MNRLALRRTGSPSPPFGAAARLVGAPRKPRAAARRAARPRADRRDACPACRRCADPRQPLQRDGAGQLSPAVAGALRARLRAEPARERRLGDRPRDAEGGRHLQGRRQSAARRAVVGPAHAVGRQQCRGPHRRQPDADRPEDRQAGQGDRRSTTRTTCTCRPTASRRSSSPRRTSGSTSATRRRWRSQYSIADAGVRRHQPRRLLDRRPVRDLHLRVRRPLAKVDLVNRKVLGTISLSKYFARPDVLAAIDKPGRKPKKMPRPGERGEICTTPGHAAGHPHLARRQALLRRRHDGRRRARRRRRVVQAGRLHPDRHRHARPVPEPRRQAAVRRQPRHATRSTAPSAARAACR